MAHVLPGADRWGHLLRRSVFGGGLLVSLFPRTLSAGNDDEVLIGTDAVMTGGAVTATVRDGSALWYNPAGLGDAKRQQVDVSGTAYTLRIWNLPEFLSSPDGKVADASTTEAVTIPSSITYVREVGERWAIGFGYFLSRWSDLRGTSLLRFPDAGVTAVWQSGYVQTYSLHNAILGASYKVSPDFHFGVALIGLYNGVTYARQFSGGLEDDTNGGFVTGTDQGTQSHTGLQLQAGFKWRASRQVQIGVSLRTPAVSFINSYEQQAYFTAGVDLSQVPEVDPGEGPSRLLGYRTQNEEDSSWGAAWLLPPRLRVGWAYQFEDGWYSVDFDVQSGIKSKIELVGSREFQASNRQAVFNIRLGGKVFMSETLSIGAGLFTDRGAQRETSLDGNSFDFYGIATGVELGNVHKLDSAERSDQLRFSTTLGVRYAMGFGKMETLEIQPFYDLVQHVADDHEYILPTRETSATAHELTFNLGAGVYF